jgi:hypothetical protein
VCMFCGPETAVSHKTHCFPEVSVNKCFVISVVYMCQSMNNLPVIGVNFETKTRQMERRKSLIK